jgi:hypothetical protein
MCLNLPVKQQERVPDDEPTLLSTTDARSHGTCANAALVDMNAAAAHRLAEQSVHLEQAIAAFAEGGALPPQAAGCGRSAAPT